MEDGTARIAYWLSFNRTDMVVKYGKGYHMEETTLLTHDFWADVQADPAYANMTVRILVPARHAGASRDDSDEQRAPQVLCDVTSDQ